MEYPLKVVVFVLLAACMKSCIMSSNTADSDLSSRIELLEVNAKPKPLPHLRKSHRFQVIKGVKGKGKKQITKDKVKCLYTKYDLKVCKSVRTCPKQCPQVKSKLRRPSNKPSLSCFIDCAGKCEPVCKDRQRITCSAAGSVCHDPRFVGGDGVMFYFHGRADQDFCLVSDRNLHINAHFIGTRPAGRSRDSTWVQSLAILFWHQNRHHSFTIAATKTATWDETEDHFSFSWDGVPFQIATSDNSTWTSPMEQVFVERNAETNSVDVVIDEVMEVSINVVPITEKDDLIHSYDIPPGDAFAHLSLQFKFFNLTSLVDGILGQTYRHDFKSTVKEGVGMPIMSGEERYVSSSLLATDCKASKFLTSGSFTMEGEEQKIIAEAVSCKGEGGFVCRR